jgi:hypothetical protein
MDEISDGRRKAVGSWTLAKHRTIYTDSARCADDPDG